MTNHVFIERGIAGQNRDTVAIFDAKTEGRQFLAAMIDFESTHADAVAIEYDTLAEFMGGELHTFGRIAFAAHADVDVKCLRQMLHHLSGPHRPPHLEGHAPLAPRAANPTGQPKIGKSDHVIRM